jgi:Asp-tRNA(Asn)/Glu-tRNA(Gln) amidotransferase C subunit
MGAIVNKITKELSNKYLKQAQFMLAIVCRSENNRVFLFHNIEMRPGYLGKWIEFITHDSDMDYDNIFDIMKVRQDRIKYSEFLDELLARVPEKSVPKMS